MTDRLGQLPRPRCCRVACLVVPCALKDAQNPGSGGGGESWQQVCVCVVCVCMLGTAGRCLAATTFAFPPQRRRNCRQNLTYPSPAACTRKKKGGTRIGGGLGYTRKEGGKIAISPPTGNWCLNGIRRCSCTISAPPALHPAKYVVTQACLDHFLFSSALAPGQTVTWPLRLANGEEISVIERATGYLSSGGRGDI